MSVCRTVRQFLRFLSAAVILVTCESASKAQYYSYQELPVLANGDKFKANAVGNGGHVVGEYDPSGDVKKAAWIWSPSRAISAAPLPAGVTEMNGKDVNVAGLAVGELKPATGAKAPFSWSTSSGVSAYGAAQGFGPGEAKFEGLNDAGLMVGEYRPAGDQRPFVYDFATGAIRGLDFNAAAKDVNNTGIVVGEDRRLGKHAFSWNLADDAVVDIGAQINELWGPVSESKAEAVNDSGLIVGDYKIGEDKYGFSWRNGVLTNLGLGEPKDVNAAGTIVGKAELATKYAFVRPANGPNFDLHTRTVNLPDGVALEEANGINDQGWIVGKARNAAGEERAFLLTPAPQMDATLLSAGSTWKYHDAGANLGGSWRTTTFDDGTWRSGRAELGYGDGDETTVVEDGPSSSNRYATTYFRTTFNVLESDAFSLLRMHVKRDDGIAVYLNGVEVVRQNLEPNAAFDALATATVADEQEGYFYVADVSGSLLRDGQNVLAVEVHQAAIDSSDISFDLKLEARAALAGDVNLDARVDRVDVARVATWFGRSSNATWGLGDVNRDGKVGLADLAVVAASFSTPSASGSAAAVPEPSSCALVLVGGVALTASRLRRRRAGAPVSRGV